MIGGFTAHRPDYRGQPLWVDTDAPVMRRADVSAFREGMRKYLAERPELSRKAWTGREVSGLEGRNPRELAP